MRASSFSSPEVVALIGRYFVPAWLSNDDYALPKKAPGDAEEVLRLRRLAASKNLVHGNVNVYLIEPDGSLIDTMGVGKAMEAENLLPWLQKIVQERGL